MARWNRLAMAAALILGVVAAVPSRVDAASGKPKPRGGTRFSAHPRLDATLIDDAAAGHAVRADRRGAPPTDDQVTVVIESGETASAAASVATVGGTVLTRLTAVVEARVPVSALGRLADSPGVVRVREPRPMRPAMTSEGVASVGATPWHTAGVNGSGIKVAVVDIGFAGYTTKLGTELPAAVETDFGQCQDTGDQGPLATAHGTAVAEIVHDVAPQASLRLVCVDTEEDFVQALGTLAAAGVDVVQASIGSAYGRGDGFGGPDSQAGAVAELRRQGILFVAAAGNYGGRHYHQNAVGDVDWPAPPVSDAEYQDFVNLTADDAFRFVVAPHGSVDIFMRWDNWPGDRSLDFDFYVFGDQCGEAAFSEFSQDEFGGSPVEYATLSLDDLPAPCNADVPQAFSLYVNRWKGTATPRLDLFIDGDLAGIEAATGSNVWEPATSPAALSVGAVCQATNDLQPYSSTGPLIDQRIKPDIVAPDATSSSVYGPQSGCTAGFGGTSASAPHVSGAAALLLDANPNLQVADVQQLLQDWAVDMGPPGRDAGYGSGRLRLLGPALAVPRTPQPFTPRAPIRLFDSRPGSLGEAELQTGQDRGSPVVGGINGSEVPVQVAGLAGVPANATAVVLNVTVTGSNRASYLTIHPGGVVPNTSNLNFGVGQTAAQHVTATVGADDRVRVFNADGAVHVIIDIAGWYGPTGANEQPGRGRFTARSAPARAFDSRPGSKGYAEPVERTAPLGPGEDIAIPVAGLGGVPASATGVIMNVTVTGGSANSFLSVYPSGSARQSVSSINWRPGQTVANLVVGSVGTGGAVRLYNEGGGVHVIVDVIGWFQPDVGAGYVALDPPTRTFDTRTGNGGLIAPVANNSTNHLEVANLYGVPNNAAAVMLSVIAVAPTQNGFLTVYPTGQARPGSSNLNFAPNETVPNAVVSGVGSSGNVALYNFGGNTHYVVDLAGYFVNRS